MNSPKTTSVTWRRDELLHLLSVSGNLAGLCIAAVALFRTIGKSFISETIADDMLAVSALLFLICIYVIFFALRTKTIRLALLLEKVADTLFLVAITGMVVSGFMMVYNVL